jgi:spermidine synthase
LGLGAGDFLSYMMKYFPDAKVDAVEINPVMIDIVKKFREKDMAKAPNYLREDGFKYVDKVTKKYDLIFCDMYLGKPSSSKKYNGLFKKIKNLLNEEGVFIWNAYFHFIPRVVAEDMLKNFENIVAAITTDGLNIVFICYQGPAKSKEELEKMAKDIQSKHNFRYSLTDQLQKFKLITPADHETWAAKFPVLE